MTIDFTEEDYAIGAVAAARHGIVGAEGVAKAVLDAVAAHHASSARGAHGQGISLITSTNAQQPSDDSRRALLLLDEDDREIGCIEEWDRIARGQELEWDGKRYIVCRIIGHGPFSAYVLPLDGATMLVLDYRTGSEIVGDEPRPVAFPALGSEIEIKGHRYIVRDSTPLTCSPAPRDRRVGTIYVDEVVR